MPAAGLARAEGPGRGPACPLWVLFSPPGQQQDKDPAPAAPCHSGQRAWALLDPKDAVDERHFAVPAREFDLF